VRMAETLKSKNQQPSVWKNYRVEDFCTTASGGTPLTTRRDYYDDGHIPWLRSGEVSQGRVRHAEISISQAGLDNSSAKLFKKGTILVAMYGATAGEVGILEFESSTNQAVCGITPGPSVDGEFLFQALLLHKPTLIKMAGGGAQPNISQEIIRNFKIPLPPIAEQRKIAEILRTWDEAIETAEAELKAKQELLKRAVAKYFEKTYRDASSGKVGELKTLDAVCTRKGEYGAAVSACPYNPEWPRYIRITDITETGILKKERAVSISPESAEGYGLKMGDLLFARTGEPGRCLIFNEAYAAAFAGYLIRFKARPEVILSEYVYFYTLSSVYYKWVGDVSQKGAQANINAKVYGSLQLPVIDLTSQEAAVRVFKSLQESVLLAEQGAELLRIQKRGLMQKLLTGEVRVAA